MSSYYFLPPNCDGTSADGTGTSGFVELDLLQKYNPLPQSPFLMPESSYQVSATAASPLTKCHTM